MIGERAAARCLLSFSALLVLGACASIASSNVTTTSIETDPPAAICKFYGQRYSHQVATPAAVNLPSNAAPVTVICEADDHHRKVAYLDTQADGWIFGNLLLGGGIGIMIDAASGSGQVYPERVFLPLEPLTFETNDTRDAWFGERRGEIETRWQTVIDEAIRRCEEQNEVFSCESRGEDLQEQRDEELARLEERRLAAKVAPSL